MTTRPRTLQRRRRAAGALRATIAASARCRRGSLSFVGMIVLWEIAGHTVLDPAFPQPALGDLAGDAARPRRSRRAASAAVDVFYELVDRFVLAVVFGVRRRPADRAQPVCACARRCRSILLIYSIPQVTILPLFVLYFGIGAGSNIAFGFSHGIFSDHPQRDCRRAERRRCASQCRARHGRDAHADHPPCRPAAHDAEPVRRPAARDVGHPARRAACRALCLDRRHRLLQPGFRRQLRSAGDFCAGHRAGDDGGLPQRNRPPRRTTRLILAATSR